MNILFRSPEGPGWAVAAAFLAEAFARKYGARITIPPITLAVAEGRDGRILGAAGLRTAADGFFSAVYLDAPVAAELGQLHGQAVREEEIVEVVSLACRAPIATLPLIEAITAEGRRAGRRWGMFTATRRLVRLLERTGVPLARARAERVADPAAWGRYYETDPWVCALPDGGCGLRFLPERRRAAMEAAAWS